MWILIYFPTESHSLRLRVFVHSYINMSLMAWLYGYDVQVNHEESLRANAICHLTVQLDSIYLSENPNVHIPYRMTGQNKYFIRSN